MIYTVRRFTSEPDSSPRPIILDLRKVERKLVESGLSKREVDIILDGLRGCDEPEKIMEWVKTGEVDDPEAEKIMKKTGLSFPAAYIESREKLFSFKLDMPQEIKIDDLILKETKPCKIMGFLGRHINLIGKAQSVFVDFDIFLRDKNIGFINFNLTGPGIVDLPEIYIKPEYQGNHYATKIISWFINYFKTRGYKKMTLDAAEGSPNAIHIYEKLGFRKVKVISKDDIWGGLTYMELNL